MSIAICFQFCDGKDTKKRAPAVGSPLVVVQNEPKAGSKLANSALCAAFLVFGGRHAVGVAEEADKVRLRLESAVLHHGLDGVVGLLA